MFKAAIFLCLVAVSFGGHLPKHGHHHSHSEANDAHAANDYGSNHAHVNSYSSSGGNVKSGSWGEHGAEESSNDSAEKTHDAWTTYDSKERDVGAYHAGHGGYVNGAHGAAHGAEYATANEVGYDHGIHAHHAHGHYPHGYYHHPAAHTHGVKNTHTHADSAYGKVHGAHDAHHHADHHHAHGAEHDKGKVVHSETKDSAYELKKNASGSKESGKYGAEQEDSWGASAHDSDVSGGHYASAEASAGHEASAAHHDYHHAPHYHVYGYH